MPPRTEMPRDIRHLQGQLRSAQKDVGAARKAGSWQAAFAGRRLCLSIKAALEEAQAEARLRVDDNLSDEALAGKLEEEAVDMPDEHLAIFVRAYCERHGLDMPRRIHAGGAS